MRWILVVLSVALAMVRSHALDCAASAIVDAPAYKSCQSATKIDLSANGKTTLLDPAAFCGYADCVSLWGLLQRLGALQCLQRYTAGSYTLKDPISAQRCFSTYSATASAAKSETAASTPAAQPIAPPTAQPASAPTASTETNTAIKTLDTSDATGTTTVESSTTSSTAPTPTSSSSTQGDSTTTPTNAGVTTFQLSGTVTANAANGVATGGSGHGGPMLESAVIGTAGTNSSGPGSKPTSPSESSTATKGDSDLQGTSRSAVYITLASCGGGVVLLVMLSIFIRRRKARKLEAKMLACLEQSARGDYVSTMRSSPSRPTATKNDSSVSSSLTTRRTRPSPKLVCLDGDIITAVRIPYAKLTLNSLVSRGGFGEVYRGMYRNRIVAIKRLLPEKRNDVYQIETFLDEVKLMASLEHEHIVRFVGVAWETVEELCVVSEFMALGDLRTLLAKFDLNEDAHPKGFTVDKLKIALHVAKALTYMHSLDPIVLHRDIKSRNILLDVNLDAKVTDFGVSRERAESTMTTGVGSTLWMAPEVMTGGRYNEKADVFSFGVVLSELDTHTIPYSHIVEPGRGRRLPDTVIVQMMTMSRISVQFTKERESPMAQLGRRCIQLDPSKRPSAKEVEDFIDAQWRSIVVAL